MRYNWQQKDWPHFTFDPANAEDLLFAFAEETGHISGMLKAAPENVKMETLINTMVAEAIKTSEIEGEYLSRQDVVSSIRNNLGINHSPELIKDKKAQGLARLMIDVRDTYADLLTEKKLFNWHEMLLKENQGINAGAWRKDAAPMQVVSGSIGKEKIHFEAPPSDRVPQEMESFIRWFNDTAPGGPAEIKKAPLRSAIAHLYFESIHPFEDGNGRIGRVLAEKALSQTLGRPVMLSLSRKIEADRKSYYQALETAQRSNQISDWVGYFVRTIFEAQIETKDILTFTLKKTLFYDRFKTRLNDRQSKVIEKMLEAGPAGFEGGMSAKKYISITKTSKPTATRDLQTLAELGVFITEGGGRSTKYVLNLET